MTENAAVAPLPLKLGTPEDFTRVREFLIRIGFTEATLCPALGLQRMSELGRVNWPALQLSGMMPALRWALEVFVHGMPGAAVDLQGAADTETFDALHRLGLLRAKKADEALLVSPVWLYPADGFLMVSDRQTDPDGGEFLPAQDVVFPAIYPGTFRFLELLPKVAGGEALDLCGGSGIGALHLARSAACAVTADITARSAFFAEFNLRMNAARAESVCGNLYDPVQGRRFDLIAAHPPFVPATGVTMVYRDGGDLGEDITRGVIEKLPEFLRPNGTCVIVCVARDTQSQAFEVRVRDWLGAAREEFDVVFGLEKVLSVEEVAESLCKRPAAERLPREEILKRLRAFETKHFVYGALYLNRIATANAAAPLRVRLTTDGMAGDFERLFAWRRVCREAGFVPRLAASRPRLAQRLELTARHVVVDGDLAPAEFVFSIAQGFEASLRLDPWVVPLLARLTGRLTVNEVYEQARAADDLPPKFTIEAFVDLVRLNIERGFMEVELPSEKILSASPTIQPRVPAAPGSAG